MNPFSKATILVVVGLFASQVRAQDPGDVGSPECRAVQLAAQAAVLAGEPYRTKGGAVRTAASVVDPAVRSGSITSECSSCIMNQFGRGVPITQQGSCGPICGNAVCQLGEDPCTCPVDCGSTCGACCLPDDSCDDLSADECTAAGGEPQGPGTECTITECCAPLGDTCLSVDDCCAGSCQGPFFGIKKCCFVHGANGCSADADCCEEGATCDAGTCCMPIGAGGCTDSTDCCAGTCRRQLGLFGGSKCCPELGPTGCSADADCCLDNEVCDAGKCCFPVGTGVCVDSTDCCAGVCDTGRCCIPQFDTGCSTDFDCCPGATCVSGRCEGVVGP